MQATRTTLPALPRLLSLALLAAALSGCAGMDLGSVRRSDGAATAAAADSALASGRIQHLVDGQPLAYGFLDKPHLSLYHRGRGVLMSSPETDADGRFRWSLPPGDYVVAVVFGGMAPTAQGLPLPDGQVIRVNGLVNPGLEFTLAPGSAQDLGTLVIEVESRLPKDVWFGSGRVFGRLRDIRVEPGPADAALPSQPLRRVARREGVEPAEAAPASAAGLLPRLLPLLIR